MGHQQNEAITKKLSEFAFNFRYANLPHEVIEQAKLFILDTLGCALGGRTQAKEEVSWITMFTDTQKSKGNSTIFGEKERTSAAIAALANGAIAHTIDFDDTHMPSITHLGSSLVATTFALGEELNSNGEEILKLSC